MRRRPILRLKRWRVSARFSSIRTVSSTSNEPPTPLLPPAFSACERLWPRRDRAGVAAATRRIAGGTGEAAHRRCAALRSAAEAAALRAEGQGDDFALHDGRTLADGSLRSEADAHEVRRAGVSRRNQV